MGDNALLNAAKNGDVDAARRCLEKGDIAGDGNNALLWAAFKGHTGVVRLLIDYGASLSATNGSGKNAHKLAKDAGHVETAALLAGAVQQPQKLPESEKWTRLGAVSVAFVGDYPAIDKKLTRIFNFETRERIVVSETPGNKSQGVAPTACFDDLPREAVEKALGEFERLGGKTDRDFVLRGCRDIGKTSKKLPGQDTTGGGQNITGGGPAP